MFKYNNNHIFTGYLKQFLSSFNLPTCRIYTREFADHLAQYGTEDPRVITSFNTTMTQAPTVRLAARINYLKNNELFNYFLDASGNKMWKRSAEVFYDGESAVHGLTKTLNSPGSSYDAVTHEYLGDYLRFLRDYHNINLMSMYNCFNNKIYSNIYFNFTLRDSITKITFDSQNPNYRIYAIPVKLFSDYTIAIDCNQGIEMFCGFYNTSLEVLSSKAHELAKKTYSKVNKTLFNQPFVYTKLNLSNWKAESDFTTVSPSGKVQPSNIRNDSFTRWDMANREKDLKLFIKVPTSCRSTITILEGDYRGFNDYKFGPARHRVNEVASRASEPAKYKTVWSYQQNRSVLNFSLADTDYANNHSFKPISKLQLLTINTGESYPFADRLIEYLSGSAITPLDTIPDNIKRVQRVMKQQKNYFKIEGIWEEKMQNILYDYMTSSGPIEVITVCDDKNDERYGQEVDKKSYTGPTKQILKDRRQGSHPRLGYTSKSNMYDILGYVDKDAEKWYASWTNTNGVAKVKTSIQNIDIYDGLYDI